MKITVKDCLNCNKDHEWEYEMPTLKEVRHIRARANFKNFTEFNDAMKDGDPDGMTALLDILHRRDGIELRWDDIDLDYDAIDFEQNEEEKAQAEQAEGKAGEPDEPSPSNGDLTAEDSTPKSPPTPADSGSTTDSPI